MPTLTTPCTISKYAVGHNGYAHTHYQGKSVRHHRLAYVIANDLTLDAIEGKVIMHLCDIRNCIEPTHLVVGPQKDNILDMQAKGRRNDAVGIKSSQAKLTESEIIRIRRSHAAGNLGCGRLAKIFKVAPSTIYAIVSGKTWKHIHKELADEKLTT